MARTAAKPAYYATARAGGWRDWWLILHPPYTAWHLSYVLMGAALAPILNGQRLAATLIAFGLAVGLGAHALDELHGRPLGTHIPGGVLATVAGISLVAAAGLGFAGIAQIGIGLIPFIVVGVILVFAYNLELVGGFAHTDFGFAVSWGAFPVLTGYFAQTGRINLTACLAAAAATAISLTQRRLSNPARAIRRRARLVAGTVTLADGSTRELDRETLLEPLESGLQALSWGVIALALAVAFTHLRW